MDSKFLFDQNSILPTKFEENSGFSAFQSRFPNGNFDSILGKFHSIGKYEESCNFPKNNQSNITNNQSKLIQYLDDNKHGLNIKPKNQVGIINDDDKHITIENDTINKVEKKHHNIKNTDNIIKKRKVNTKGKTTNPNNIINKGKNISENSNNPNATHKTKNILKHNISKMNKSKFNSSSNILSEDSVYVRLMPKTISTQRLMMRFNNFPRLEIRTSKKYTVGRIIEHLRQKWLNVFDNQSKTRKLDIKLKPDEKYWLSNMDEYANVLPFESYEISENYMLADICAGYNNPNTNIIDLYYEIQQPQQQHQQALINQGAINNPQMNNNLSFLNLSNQQQNQHKLLLNTNNNNANGNNGNSSNNNQNHAQQTHGLDSQNNKVLKTKPSYGNINSINLDQINNDQISNMIINNASNNNNNSKQIISSIQDNRDDNNNTSRLLYIKDEFIQNKDKDDKNPFSGVEYFEAKRTASNGGLVEEKNNNNNNNNNNSSFSFNNKTRSENGIKNIDKNANPNPNPNNNNNNTSNENNSNPQTSQKTITNNSVSISSLFGKNETFKALYNTLNMMPDGESKFFSHFSRINNTNGGSTNPQVQKVEVHRKKKLDNQDPYAHQLKLQAFGIKLTTNKGKFFNYL